MSRAGSLVTLAVSTIVCAGQASAQLQSGATWDENARSFSSQPGRRATLVCVADTVPRRIWGTDVYTDDSSICTAAVHAGVLQPGKAGLVTVVVGSGASAYLGSLRNNVTSMTWGPSGTSFSFTRAGRPWRQSPFTRSDHDEMLTTQQGSRLLQLNRVQ